jgi:hypothetical protein
MKQVSFKNILDYVEILIRFNNNKYKDINCFY